MSTRGKTRPAAKRNLLEADLLALYRGMALVRALDTRLLMLQRQGRIGFYGSAMGEEAAVIGSAYALGPEDWVFPALRQVGAALLRGYPLRAMLAQLLGSGEDILKGRQMPCHYSWRGARFVTWSSCIGTQLTQAVGAALAARYRKDGAVAMAYLGDGATSAIDFHAAANFAGVFRAPVVFLCQNNQFAISVPIATQTASKGIAVKAKAYGFPGVSVDGNDVLAVWEAAREAVARARQGEGPTLIEAVTYRRGGHSSSDDPGRYRDESKTREWEKRDPIERFRRLLQGKGLWSAAKEEDLGATLEREISDAIREAEKAGPPERATLFEEVYGTMPWHISEQMREAGGKNGE